MPNISGLNDAIRTYTFTVGNTFIQAQDGAATKSYAYDAAGERVWASDGVDETFYVRDEGGQVVSELAPNGTGGLDIVVEYIYGPTGLLAQDDANGFRFVASDHLGSSRVLVDPVTGPVETPVEMSPYGQLMGGNTSPSTTHLFTGHERDFDLGLDYMHARYYSPGIGRFLSVDPVGGEVGLSQSWNRYGYVRGNPLGLVDPTGMMDAIMPGGGVEDVNRGTVYSRIETRADGSEYVVHVGMVVGFTDVEKGETPEAIIIENVPTNPDGVARNPIDQRDSEPHQPVPVKASEANYQGAQYKTEVFRNYQSGHYYAFPEFSKDQMEAAIAAVGEVRYENSQYGSFEENTDCSGYVNQLLRELGGDLYPRSGPQSWKR